MAERTRERVGWIALLIVGAVPIAFGVKGLLTSAPGNPAVVGRLTGLEWGRLQAEQPGVGRLVGLLSRHEAVALLGWGFWLVWTAILGYRTGERWVWYGWWTVPVLVVAVVLTGEGAGGGLRPVLLGVAALAVVGLVLSYRGENIRRDRSAA